MNSELDGPVRIRQVALPVLATVVMAIHAAGMQRVGTPVAGWSMFVHDGLALLGVSWQVAVVRNARWHSSAVLVAVLHFALLAPLWFGWRLGLAGDAF